MHVRQVMRYAALCTTCAAAVLIEVYGRRLTGFDVFSLSFWFVMPAGALLLGLLCGSGYTLGSYALHVRPQWYDVAVLTLAISSTILIIQYVDYATFSLPDGRKAFDLTDFSTYFDLAVRTSHLRVGRTLSSDTGAVGEFGYVLFGLQTVAFLIGGLFTYAITLSLPACAHCTSYLRKVRSKVSPPIPPDYTEALIQLCRGTFDDLAKAITWAGPVQPASEQPSNTSMSYSLLECPHCKRESVVATPRKMSRNGWEPIPKLSVRRDLSPGTTLFAEFK